MSKKNKKTQQEKSQQQEATKSKLEKIKRVAENVQKQTERDADDDEKEDTKGNNFSTDWDLDKYRREYESDEHWQLRRRFMQVHKTKFPEDKLVCLAQVFINMEFLGCKYPVETMQRVNELSRDVAKEFRASRVNRLKRTFITASDAAETRAKGCRTNTDNKDKKQQHQQDQLQQRMCNKKLGNQNACQVQKIDFGMQSHVKPVCSRLINNDEYSKNTHKEINLFDGLKFGQFVLTLNSGRNSLRQSCQRCNMEYRELEECTKDQPNLIKIVIYIDNLFVAEACEANIKSSKAEAFNKALTVLQEHCYSIKQNSLRDTIKIGKTKSNKVICAVSKNLIDGSDEDKRLDATNKGYKMMKMMGWTGGGLGVQKQGRENPVNYLLKNNRAGFGNDAEHLDCHYFTQMLKNYINSADIRELHFEPNFTKCERLILHKIANKFNLKSVSYGQESERHLIISKKTISDADILKEVLLKKNPQYMDTYFVQVPASKQSLFPEHMTRLSL